MFRKEKVAIGVLGLCVASLLQAQPDEKLCDLKSKPAIAKMTLHWDNFNRYGNSQSKDIERNYVMSGEGAACKIQSESASGGKITRPCTWTPRMTCDLEVGKDPIAHKISFGSSTHEGTLAWSGNDRIKVNVKQGDTVTSMMRDVAVVKFKGMWSSSGGSGVSTSTVYYDREWGIMVKTEGWNSSNQWGNTVSLVEIAP